MKKNNFTKNENGASIEVVAYCDIMLAQENFKENFDTMAYDSRQNIALLKQSDVLGDTILDFFEFLPNVSKDERDKFLSEFKNQFDIIKALYLGHEYATSLCKIKDCYAIHNSKGYNQGDSVLVILNASDRNDQNLKSIDALIWDCPIYLNVTIDENEFFYSDFKDTYASFDKNGFIDWICDDESNAKNKEYIKNELNKLIPDYIE